MLVQRQDVEREMNEKLQKLQHEKQTADELATSLQRTLAAIETEKRSAERSAMRLQKDKCALKKTIDKVQFSSVQLRRVEQGLENGFVFKNLKTSKVRNLGF